MGAPLIAEKLGCSKQEAQQILDDFDKGFPKIKAWKDESVETARKCGYAEDLWGRRRRLPELNLPKYDFHLKDSAKEYKFNPLLDSAGEVCTKETNLIKKYSDALGKVSYSKAIRSIKDDALKMDGLEIFENGNKISSAERQCANARIQGSAATMTKKAMILVHDDEILRDLGFTLLIAVHDELIGECPTENSEKVADRLSYLMKHAADDAVKNVPFKCDAAVTKRWYEDEYIKVLGKKYHKLVDDGHLTKEEACDIIKSENPESYVIDLQEITG